MSVADQSSALESAHVAARVAIELDGGAWTGGRHVRGAGFACDCEKLNAAAAHGWRVFRLTASMLAEQPDAHLLRLWRQSTVRQAHVLDISRHAPLLRVLAAA